MKYLFLEQRGSNPPPLDLLILILSLSVFISKTTVGDANGNLRINDGIPPGPHPRIRAPIAQIHAARPVQRREIPREGHFIGGFGAFAGLGALGLGQVPGVVNQANQLHDRIQLLHAVYGGGPQGAAPHPYPHPQPQRYNQPPKAPEKFANNMSYRSQSKSAVQLQSQKGLHFSQAIIEPTIDVETYEVDKTKVVGPLDDTTVICCSCDDALLMGAEGDRKLFALPCGHVVDGKCFWKLSLVKEKEREWEELEEKRELELIENERKEKEREEKEKELESEKRKRVVVLVDDDEEESQSGNPRSRKSARISNSHTNASSSSSKSRTLRNGKAFTNPGLNESTSSSSSSSKPKPKPKPRKPSAKTLEKEKMERKRAYVYLKMGINADSTPKGRQLRSFKCPVVGCGMKVIAEMNHRTSAFELFC